VAKTSGGVRSWNVSVRLGAVLRGPKMHQSASEKIRSVIREIRQNGFSKAAPFSIGKVEQRMQRFASANNITIPSKDVYMSVKGITHAMRDSKQKKGLAVSARELADFPKKRRYMDLYYDGEVFIYTNGKSKFILNPNYEMKISKTKRQKVNFITATKVTDKNEFNGKRYIRVK